MSESIRLFAASSLKSALTPLLADFSHQTGVAVDVHYAPAGLLREPIEADDNCSLFLSANEAHTDALMKSHRTLRREVIAHDLLALAVRREAVTQNRDWLSLSLRVFSPMNKMIKPPILTRRPLLLSILQAVTSQIRYNNSTFLAV